METGLAILVGLVALVLMLQRWFWVLVFFVGGLAACFAILASVIHFQILGAVAFFFLMIFAWSIASAISEI